jgi:hypothetical protein
MNRLKLFATATLMALTFTACDEGTPPPVEPPPPPTPVGTISGSVTIEGTAASGITATLSSGATTTTGAGGNFAFSGVEAGTYTVTISGFPEDATFAQVTQSATIASDGQNVQLNFAGEYIRSSAVVGNVVAADAMMSGGDGQPETLAGVTVTLGGEHAMGETMETDMTGGFAFTGLRAGTYTVTISDFPEDVSFEEVSLEIAVEVGDVGQADFTGHFIRTSAVEGQVIIDGEGLPGVTVTLVGGPADESYTMMTDTDGMYRFEELRPGDYTVSITDFDTRDYEFAATSQDVSVDLDETGTVSFTGVLLRTSGISGRVSVEGMGLGDIEVTLAGGEGNRTAMTDAGGQYSFAGLAAGDYTVSIAVASDAYVFESMTEDVTLGDDDARIVNFEGAHARTASVSGMVFIDEATKNDMFDEGEAPLAHAGIPVALVGPGVNEQRLGATDANGAFSFAGLQAGSYQLVVLINADVAAALAGADLAYGGPGEGYSMALGVGEAASQAIPFDITHTTVNFTVSLKHGDDMGDAVPGAMVTLYSDAAGETRVGGGETGDDGSVAIKVARAGTSGNMVMAGVSAEGYDVADGMTEVSWDPQMFATAAGNSNDIVNLNVDATVSGATVTTDYGGGEALVGWAISVMHGEDAVEGAPEMLGDDGNASFMTTVGADDLPATFTVAIADDQDNELDGGENYDGDSVEYTHTGLMLAGTQDAGTLEVAFTTQTLKVYVHHERDQVEGYTGNVLDGDKRDTAELIDVELRYIDASGRSRAFQSSDSIDSSSNEGAWTFSNVPADKNVIAQAEDGQDPKADDYVAIMLLDEGGHSDELATYMGTDTNGITGGHFGAHGGYSHTVSLCPLQGTKPQDHGECSSFAYVSAHGVSGLIWKRSIAMDDGDDFEEVEDPDFVEGITVSLMPVDGKNLAGEEQSFTTLEEDDDDTEEIDETHQFDFGDIASGAYELSVPDGWRARLGGKDATDMIGNALNPLGDGGAQLDITPATATVYGFVVDENGLALPDAAVTANNASTTTDVSGRFILDGIEIETRTISRKKVTGIFVEASVEGVGKDSHTIEGNAAALANQVMRVLDDNGDDLTLTAAAETASISGTVRASGTAAPVAGARVEVSYDDGATFVAPENKNAKSKGAAKNDINVTGADGTYTATVRAQNVGEGVSIRVSKDGMSFVPGQIHDLPAHAGSSVSGFDFTGFVNATITGTVIAAGGGPMSGVTVTATESGADAAAAATDSDVTGRTGRFSLSVPFDRYTIEATAPEGDLTRFSYPDDEQDVRVAPGQRVNFGKISGKSVGARSISASRTKDDDGNYEATIDVSWRFDNVAGFASIVHTIQTCVAENCAATTDWTDAALTADSEDDNEAEGLRVGTIPVPADSDGGFKVRINVGADEDDGAGGTNARTGTSAVISVGAVDSSPSGITAMRDTAEGATTDSLIVNWTASTNGNTQTRVIITVEVDGLGEQSLVAAGGASLVEDGVTDATSAVYTVSGFVAADWTVVGTSQTLNVTEVLLRKALKVHVETGQGASAADVDDDDWKASDTVSVAADPTDG